MINTKPYDNFRKSVVDVKKALREIRKSQKNKIYSPTQKLFMHELNGKIGSSIELYDMWMKGEIEDSAWKFKYLPTVKKNISRADELIELAYIKELDIETIRKGQVEDARKTIVRMVNRNIEDFREDGISVQITGKRCPVDMNPAIFRGILSTLEGNSAQHAQPNTPINYEVFSDDEKATILIENYHIPGEKRKISGQGIGFGQPFIKREVLNKIGGKIIPYSKSRIREDDTTIPLVSGPKDSPKLIESKLELYGVKITIPHNLKKDLTSIL